MTSQVRTAWMRVVGVGLLISAVLDADSALADLVARFEADPGEATRAPLLARVSETVSLEDQSIPEVVFLNSHNGGSSYIARIGIFRVVCCNGLIASRGAFLIDNALG